MQCLRPGVDVIFLEGDEEQLQIRDHRAGKVLKSDGASARALMAALLDRLPGRCSPDRAADLRSRMEMSREDSADAYRLLRAQDVLCAPSSRESAWGAHRCWRPFIPEEIEPGIFAVRKDLRVWWLRAASDAELFESFAEVVRLWVAKDDYAVGRKLLQKPDAVWLLSGYCLDDRMRGALAGAVPSRQRSAGPASEGLLSAKADRIEVVDRLAHVEELIARSSDGYWRRLASELVKLDLMAKVAKVPGDGGPFPLSRPAFRAAHRVVGWPEEPGSPDTGSGETDIEACSKAMMEAVERFVCQTSRSGHEAVVSTRDRLPSPAVEFGELARYPDAQWRFPGLRDRIRPYSPDDGVRWVAMRDVGTGESKWVPADFVYYGLQIDRRTPLFRANSNGCAAESTPERAIAAATRELVERDALMLWWLTRGVPPKLSDQHLSPYAREVIERLAARGYEVRLLDLTIDIFPVTLAVARAADGARPYFFSGLGCAFGMGRACDKAVSELELSVWHALHAPDDARAEAVPLFDIATPSDHQTIYMDPANRRHVDHLFETQRQAPPRKDLDIDTVQDLSGYFRKKRLGVLSLSFEGEEIRSCRSVHVVRCVIPGLMPMTFGYGQEPLGMLRLAQAAGTLSGARLTTPSAILEGYMPHFLA
jgi:ribosomal protein S12 methylthiotransferase accessory factor